MSLWPFHRRKKTNIASQYQSLQGIQLQSAAAAIAIPIVYGQACVAGNLIHYKDLVGGTVENMRISLTHAVIVMGICEGPIADIVHVWYDRQSRAVTGPGGLTVFTGTSSQAAWGFLTTNFPAEAVPYELTAYVASSTWPLKEGGSLPNFNWEVRGFLQWNYPTIPDSNPKDVVTDFLTDPNHGALFPAAQLGNLTAFRDYCTAAGIFLSPVYTAQQSAAQHMVDLLALANSAFVWSDGLLKIVPSGDTAITGNGVTFTPNVTPIYNLTDDDFLSDSDDPVTVTRVAQADAYNHIQLQFENRAKSYNIDIAEAKDQASIELTGLRTAPVMNAPQIKDANVARFVVQLALQRSVYIRNIYEFALPLRYVLLEPMDLVTLTDLNLGLNQTTVRITRIEEQDDSTFLVTAEEWPFGVATAALYPTPGDVGYAPNIPSSPNPPVIAVSFDSTGQAILNLTGDKKTVEHIYTVRTDRIPTLAETQAGTVSNIQTPPSISTGVVVAAGAAVYVGDLTYNTWGDESALVTAVFRREGSGTSAPPVAIITPLNTEGDSTTWNIQFSAVAGSGGGGTNLTYVIKAKWGTANEVVLSSGDATAFPLSLGIARDVQYQKIVRFILTDTATGITVEGRFVVAERRDEVTTVGGVLLHKRIVQFDDGGYALQASNSAGTTIPVAVTYADGVTGIDARKPAEAGANVTETRTSADTAAVSGTAATTIKAGSLKADAALDASHNLITGITAAAKYADGVTLIDAMKPAQAGADVTSANTAAAIAGQGALATKSAVDLATADVTNKTQDNIADTLTRFASPVPNATSDVVLVASAGITLGGNNATKTGGAGWNEQVYSKDGYTGGAFASAVVPHATDHVAFGLNTDPLTDASFTSIDYGIHAANTGTLYYIANGIATLIGTWVAGDAFAVTYDGSNVRFLQNGTVFGTIAVGAGIQFYFDSAFYYTGSTLNNIRFGPMSSNNAAAIGDGNLGTGINDSRLFALNKHFNTDQHTFDDVPDGALTYKKTLATRVSAGKPLIDFSEAIHLNKSLANVDSAASTKLGGIATGADVTSANTAAAIAGQGALATKDSIAAADVNANTLGAQQMATRAFVIAYNSTAHNLTTGVAAVLGWDSENADTTGIHDTTGSFTSRITIPTGGNIGVWFFSAMVTWAANATGRRRITLATNGTVTDVIGKAETLGYSSGGTGPTQITFGFLVAPAVGTYVELWAFQDSGGFLADVASPTNTFISAVHLW